jgi:hypothetical protein
MLVVLICPTQRAISSIPIDDVTTFRAAERGVASFSKWSTHYTTKPRTRWPTARSWITTNISSFL